MVGEHDVQLCACRGAPVNRAARVSNANVMWIPSGDTRSQCGHSKLDVGTEVYVLRNMIAVEPHHERSVANTSCIVHCEASHAGE